MNHQTDPWEVSYQSLLKSSGRLKGEFFDQQMAHFLACELGVEHKIEDLNQNSLSLILQKRKGNYEINQEQGKTNKAKGNVNGYIFKAKGQTILRSKWVDICWDYLHISNQEINKEKYRSTLAYMRLTHPKM